MDLPIKRLALFSAAALAVLLAGCAGTQPAAPGAAVTATSPAAIATMPPTAAIPPTGPTAVQTPGAPVISTAVAVTSVPVMPTGVGDMPTEATGPTQAGTPVITLANNGGSISLHPGDRFVLSLGEMYDWSISISDPNVLHRVINITPLRGSQGVYEAGSAGSTVLSAAGDPHCRQSQPPCAMPSVTFELNVTVSP
jgi:hypothetical protein